MTGRWITVGLCALALAGCNKKEADKPPPPKAETPATPPATTPTTPPVTPPAETPVTPPVTPPPAAVEPTGVTPAAPTPGVAPTTTADAPATFVPVKPVKVLPKVIKLPPRQPGQGTDQAASRAAGQRPPIRIGKTAAQLKAEKDILGLWIEQKRRNAILNFTLDGAVAYREKITDTPKWAGTWKAGPDGVVQFGLAYQGANSSLQFSAYPTAAQIMAVAPHWTKEWGGSGQYAYERMK